MTKWMRTVGTNIGSATELLGFVWQGKRWWLTPIIIALLLLTVIVFLLESAAVAPFIYVLF
jgi:hypothetical protein